MNDRGNSRAEEEIATQNRFLEMNYLVAKQVPIRSIKSWLRYSWFKSVAPIE